MDLSQIDHHNTHNTEVLFFMGQEDIHLRDDETEEDLAYWEDDLATEDTTITEMIRGRTESTDKTCYHCNAVGHFKAQCPQRRQGFRKTPHPTIYLPRSEEETDQVTLQTPHDEELVHRPHGREVRVVAEGGTSTTGPGSPRSPRSRKMTTQRRLEAPQDPEQDF